nr:MAG TPA: hypothetical protein [Caudoviricetes sp.]
MRYTEHRERNIRELCTVERAATGKKYKAGSCYVKLSAVDDFVGQIKEAGEIDSRFAVFEPREDIEGIDAEYLFLTVSRSFPEFLRRYRTTINLQFDTLQHFTVQWHDDAETRRDIVEKQTAIAREIQLVEAQIEREKQAKKWYLAKMFV